MCKDEGGVLLEKGEASQSIQETHFTFNKTCQSVTALSDNGRQHVGDMIVELFVAAVVIELES